MHARREAEVLMVQSGTMEISWANGSVVLGAGDTFTVPVDLDHAFRNTASVDAVVFVVRGGENPARPSFQARSTR
jgi:mannose-6-phosphate isomerase-like protein (cupin superfamily)